MGEEWETEEQEKKRGWDLRNWKEAEDKTLEQMVHADSQSTVTD